MIQGQVRGLSKAVEVRCVKQNSKTALEDTGWQRSSIQFSSPGHRQIQEPVNAERGESKCQTSETKKNSPALQAAIGGPPG